MVNHDTLQKFIPVYAGVGGDSFTEVLARVGSSYTPPQTGWRVESKTLADTCTCRSGRFTKIANWWVHVYQGCGKALPKTEGKFSKSDLERLASIQAAPDDTYLNGMYSTLGGRDANDPRSWITRGRSEYRERTRGMVLWGSSRVDKPSWDGNTLAAIDKVKAELDKKKETKLRDGVEWFSKKHLPRTMGEL